MTVTGVLHALGFELNRMSERDRKRVGATLRQLGWESRRGEDGTGQDGRRRRRRVFVRGLGAAPKTTRTALRPRAAEDRPTPLFLLRPSVAKAPASPAPAPAASGRRANGEAAAEEGAPRVVHDYDDIM